MEFYGKWGAPHDYHVGQIVRGISVESGKSFVATILGDRKGFTVEEEDGRKRTFLPGQDVFVYKVKIKMSSEKNPQYTSFRLKAT